jgi:hypothetical protein
VALKDPNFLLTISTVLWLAFALAHITAIADTSARTTIHHIREEISAANILRSQQLPIEASIYSAIAIHLAASFFSLRLGPVLQALSRPLLTRSCSALSPKLIMPILGSSRPFRLLPIPLH